MGNKRIPAIRFPGFIGDWEWRKFKDFISKTGKKNTSGENYPAFSVSNQLGLVNQTEQFDQSRLDNLDKKSYKLVNPKEFAYNPARINVGSIAFNDLNKTVIVSSLYVVLKMNEKLDDSFILQFMKSQPFINEVRRNTEGSVREYLFYESFKNVKFPYTTNKSEQIKIGTFLKQLDDLIANHEQKLNTFKQTKQGFLQKMFPKEGESVSEIRFPGFSGNWERQKLVALATFSKGKGYSKKDLVDEGKPIILYGRLYTKYETIIESVDTYTTEKKNSIISEGSEVIVPSSGETSEDISRASVVMQSGVILGGDLNIIRPINIIDSTFLALAISNGKSQKELRRRTQGNSVVHLYNSDIKEVYLYYPEKEEQQKIGNFFKQLDDTIALHERELETLKQTKKAFLQKMFA